MSEIEKKDIDDPVVNTQPNKIIDASSGDSKSVSAENPYSREADDGFDEKCYSDAHYVPESENTVPPRYYTPPEPKEPKHKKKSGKGKKLVAVIAACLVCALLGGIGGAGLISNIFNDRLGKLETELKKHLENQNVLTTVAMPSLPTDPDSSSNYPGISAKAIYDDACKHVVGISSNISVQSMFGNRTASVTGSAFILTSDGYILTNYHVIEDAYKSNAPINVMMHDGTSYPATIVGFEADNDVAVLKIEAEGLTPAVIGNSDALNVGDVVYAVGNPLGELEFSMTTGHVSAKDRKIGEENSADKIHMFQLDAAVNSGNSGGPVYNDQGQVVGIVTAKYTKTGVEGLGFAIPINDAAVIANDIITKGYVTGKAYMALSIRNDYTSMYANYYGWPMGAMVGEVNEGGAAEKAGIQAGDIITKLGGIEVQSYNDLKVAVKQYSAGDTVDVTLYRAGSEMTMPITFDEALPEVQAETQTQSQPQVQEQPQIETQIPDVFEEFMFPGFSFGY